MVYLHAFIFGYWELALVNNQESVQPQFGLQNVNHAVIAAGRGAFRQLSFRVEW